jgi:DMSO/TMAO reductase YedYZ molybdopterin-dependent catalytic subunit
MHEDAPEGTTAQEGITRDELRLAARNHGMPMEVLREDVTPIGLHYLLTHYDIPAVDPHDWRLRVDGLVEQPLQLGLDELRERPAVTQDVTMECAGTGRARIQPRTLSQPWLHHAVGTGRWTGTPLWPLLEEAGLADEAVEVLFTGLDRGVEGGQEQSYQRSLPLDELRRDEVVLAYALNGQPLPPQHGFPVRLLVPGWYGMTQVKWLASIEAIAEPFHGYQQDQAYRIRQEPDDDGEPVSRIVVRSLLQPPGIPEFYSRDRVVEPGTHRITGRAWSGHGPITAVEISADGGTTWQPATVQAASGPHAWHGFHAHWDAEEPGEHELVSRATDAAGNTQPLEAAWNLGGYAVNAVHRVRVTVREA